MNISDYALSKRDLETIMKLAENIEDLYERTGFISISAAVIRIEDKTTVHLREGTFKETFKEWKETYFSASSNKLEKEVGEVIFYALESVERVQEPEKEVKQETLPAVQMSKQKIDVITMLIDYYRLKERPDEGLENFLTGLRKELESLK